MQKDGLNRYMKKRRIISTPSLRFTGMCSTGNSPSTQESFTDSTLPLTVQYILGLAGLGLVNLVASGRYCSSAKDDWPQGIYSCSCSIRPVVPDDKKWVICDRCKGFSDKLRLTPLMLPFFIGSTLSCAAFLLARDEYMTLKFAQEMAAVLLAVSASWTVTRFWVRGLAPLTRRIRTEKGDKASALLIQRLDQYHKQKELKRAENSLISEEPYDPSVLTEPEYSKLLAAITCSTITLGVLLGAWISLLPVVALAVWSTALPGQVETLLEEGFHPLDWCRAEWRKFTAPAPDKVQKTAAELAAVLAKETDPIRVRAIKEALIQITNTVRGALGSELIEVCRDIDKLQKRVRSGEPKSDAEWTAIWLEHANSHKRLAELESEIAVRTKECPTVELCSDKIAKI